MTNGDWLLLGVDVGLLLFLLSLVAQVWWDGRKR